MLTSLTIKNFRSLEDFEVKKLGRVNLIVGKNNSGKSTVLEALRIYAGNAYRPLLESIADEHDERYIYADGEFDEQLPFQDLFTGRQFPSSDDVKIQIGPLNDEASVLNIRHVYLSEYSETKTNEKTGETSTNVRRRVISKALRQKSNEKVSHALAIGRTKRLTNYIVLDPNARKFFTPPGSVDVIPCSVVPTQFISIDELADGWDKIVFTEHEDVVKEALRIISPDFENITFVRNEGIRSTVNRRGEFQRSARVKLASILRPIPLNSLGDGVLRILQLAIKILPAKGGFLLIDEFENGLHYSVQEKVWELLFEMAKRLDFQVFATTHSWDCIESFTKVAVDRADVNGVLFRVGRSVRASDKGKVIATVFDEDALANITQAEVEVR